MFGKRDAKMEFFTEVEGLLAYPPAPASKFYPDWFKKMKPSYAVAPNQLYPFGLSDKLRLSNVNATVRRCPGIISYLSEGYIVPLWTDFVVQIRANSVYAFGSNETAQVGLHSRQMHFNTMPGAERFYPDAVKFTNPWKVRTPKGWSVLLTSPFYHFEDRFVVCPGVVDSDRYHHIHVNTLWRKDVGDYELRMGVPFVQIIPFQREALKLEIRQSTEEDKKLIRDLRFRSERFFGKNREMRKSEEG